MIYCSECTDVALTEEEIALSKKNRRKSEYLCYYCKCETIEDALASQPDSDMKIALPKPEMFGRTKKETEIIFAERAENRAKEKAEKAAENPADLQKSLLLETEEVGDSTTSTTKKSKGRGKGKGKGNKMKSDPLSGLPIGGSGGPIVLRHEVGKGNYVELSIRHPLTSDQKKAGEALLKAYWDDYTTLVFGMNIDKNLALRAMARANIKMPVGFHASAENEEG